MTLALSACGARWSGDQEVRDISRGQQAPLRGFASGESSGVSGGETPAGVGTLLSPAPGQTARTPSAASSDRTGQPTKQGSGGTFDPGPHPGVTDTEITACTLVPLTGAAPVPTTWDKGASLYWDYLNKRGGVYGRKVRLVVKDTGSDAATALARARECINEQTFGFTVLDRLEVSSTVGRFLNDQGIPHVLIQAPATSATDPGSDQVNTFGITIDHRAQGRLIADYFTTGDLAGKRYAYVRENVPDLVPSVEAFKARLRQRGGNLVAEDAVDGQGNDFSSTVLKLKQAKADVVWFYGAPTPLIMLAQQSQAAAYHPIWFGNSISWNFDVVAQVGNASGALNGARAFSPWVALSTPAADDYKAAYREFYPNETADDIGLAGWGVGEVVHAALLTAGRSLGRNTMRSALQSLNTTPKTWSPERFGPGVRVGSNSVVEFRIDGSHWDQVGTFRSSF